LAAGAGPRFGGRKLLAPWRGEPLVRAAARTALASPVDGCTVIVGCDAALVEAAVADLGGSRLSVVRAPDWADGLSASIRRGIRALPTGSRGVVVFLADMPLLSADAVAPLIAALERGAIGAEYVYRGRPAHPVAFSCRLFEELSSLRGDVGGRHLLSGREDVVRIEAPDSGATYDVDRPSDLDA
jgi:molybdenum cofactor cytidylyltransferase